ncbi:hypothetical protein LCGC14_0896640 [marine sediment metagenome]|uniref:Uncharacterized protein n=1 Tax=marine sediment metagenome TaxID=412755 RepID=A0A0F9RGW0_9ZZZZ
MGTQVWKRRSITGKRKPVYTDDDRLLVLQLYSRGAHDEGPGQLQVPGLSQQAVARMVGMSQSNVGYVVSPIATERRRLYSFFYSLQNRDEEQARGKLYRLEHPEEILAYKRRHRQEHPELRQAETRRYRAKYPDEIRVRHRRYCRERYASDPAYRARCIAEAARRGAKNYAKNKDRVNARRRARRKEMKSGDTSI